MLRVSVVAVSLNGRTEAARASPAMPNPKAPTHDAAKTRSGELDKVTTI